MSSKRLLKKRINAICNDLSNDIQHAAYLYPEIDEKRALDILSELAALKIQSLGKVTFAFDKARKDFDSDHAYNKALHAYKVAAYTRLRKEFSEKAAAIIKQMNDLIPADIRKLVSPEA